MLGWEEFLVWTQFLLNKMVNSELKLLMRKKASCEIHMIQTQQFEV